MPRYFVVELAWWQKKAADPMPQTEKEGGMTIPGAASLLVGIAVGLFAAVWLGSSPSGAVSIVQQVAILASAAVATLAIAMGGLVMSDWQADMESRHGWAQLGLTPTELSTPVQLRTAWDIESSYQNSATNEALLAIFRARRAMQAVQPEGAPTLLPEPNVAPTRNDHANQSEELSGDGVRHQTSSRPLASNVHIFAAVGPRPTAKLHVKRAALPAHLVANGLPWQAWATYELSPLRGVALSAGSTAEIITLSSSQGVPAQRPTEVAGTIDPAIEAPSCRGPPPLKQHRSTRCAAAGVGRAGAASSALRDGDLLVRDDLGHPVPVCATELAVIETYLGDILDELVASSRARSEPERV